MQKWIFMYHLFPRKVCAQSSADDAGTHSWRLLAWRWIQGTVATRYRIFSQSWKRTFYVKTAQILSRLMLIRLPKFRAARKIYFTFQVYLLIYRSHYKPGLWIRSIFGRIRHIRILKTGSGSYSHLSRINSNIYIFSYQSDLFRYIKLKMKIEKFAWQF